MHKPIQIKNLSYSFSHKICFDDFTTQIHYGSRIAIIGRNGTGKSSLLKILKNDINPTHGIIKYDHDVTLGFVPQIIDEYTTQSGGQRFNKALTHALNLNPNVLLLDEPTNHLDQRNRRSLLKMLQNYHGTLIIATHDTELLRHCVDTLWHIDNSSIKIFSGNYDNYIESIQQHRQSITKELTQLTRQKESLHQSLMQEQQRAAKSRSKGEKSIDQRKWPSIVSKTKALNAEKTSGQKKSALRSKKQYLIDELDALRLPEEIIPTFSISTDDISQQIILSISDGYAGYEDNWVIENINFSMYSKDRVAITGDNASGKSTLIKAILQKEKVIRSGNWNTLKHSDMGYLDQHYNSLSPEKTVYETISELMPAHHSNDIRSHLNRFLFRKNEEVNNKVAQLSGGEKARLVLAQIAAQTPKLLILDEITNNLDLETRTHVISVLRKYPGAMIIISHDENFTDEVLINDKYQIENKRLIRR